MAFEQNLQTLSAQAAADLSAKQFYAVKFDTAGKINLATAAKNIDGILQNKPTTDQAALIAYDGVSKAALSGTVSNGDLLEVASGGTFVTLASGTAVCKALEAGVTGNTIAVKFLRSNAAYT